MNNLEINAFEGLALKLCDESVLKPNVLYLKFIMFPIQ